MNRNMLILLFAWLLAANVSAQGNDDMSLKREFRGAWIQAVNGQFKGMPTEQMQQTLTAQLNALQEAGINAIIFQVRPEADALYPSEIEPWSRFLTGEQA